jgi:outer membrane autotransporter protein
MSFIHKIYLHRIIYALFSCVFVIYSLESGAVTYDWTSGNYTNAIGNTISGNPAVDGSGVVLGTFNNNGIVSSSISSGKGFWFNISGTSTQSIINAGSIDGGRYGIRYEPGTSLFSLVNTGNISSSINNIASSVAVSNNGTITSIENSGSMIGVNKGIGTTSGTISTIDNSGTISASGNEGDAISITAGNTGLGSVGSITNTGNLVGTHASINNDGALGALNNLQGVGNSNGALTYTGTLPTHYNIIVNSPTQYGQLSGSSLSGSTTFGIYSGSSLIKGHTYATVLSGVSSTQLGTTIRGFSNGLNYYLQATDLVNWTWNLNVWADYTQLATNQNQYAVASGLTSAANGSVSTAGQTILDSFNSMTDAQAQTAFNSISGEGVSAQQTANFSATNLIVDASRRQANYWIMDECQTGASSKKNKAASHNALPTTCASNDNKQFRSWMTGVGGSNSLDGSSSVGSASVSTRTGGGIVGFDYEVSSHLLVGGMVGGTSSNYNVSARSSTGTDSSGQVGLYSVAKWEKLYVNTIFNYGYFSGDSTRYVSGVGSTAEQTGTTSSNAFTGRIEVGYRMDHPLVNLMPFVAMQATSLQMNSFKESNTDNLGLSVSGNTTMSEPGSLGIQLDRAFDINEKWSMYPLLRMAWVHEFQTDRSINASLQALPTGNWTVNGASAAYNAANVGISFQAMNKQGIAIFASGNAEASSTTQSYMGELGIKWLF